MNNIMINFRMRKELEFKELIEDANNEIASKS